MRNRLRIFFTGVSCLALCIIAVMLILIFTVATNTCNAGELKFTVSRNYIPGPSGYKYEVDDSTGQKIYDGNRPSITQINFVPMAEGTANNYSNFEMTMDSVIGHFFADWDISAGGENGNLNFDMFYFGYAYALSLGDMIMRSTRILPAIIPDSVTVSLTSNSSATQNTVQSSNTTPSSTDIAKMNRRVSGKKSYIVCIIPANDTDVMTNTRKQSMLFAMATAIVFQEK